MAKWLSLSAVSLIVVAAIVVAPVQLTWWLAGILLAACFGLPLGLMMAFITRQK